MEWMSGWIQGIIIAVIISTIIEMILPEGTSKKYIKVVIGVYILFSIVSPVISKVTGNEFRVSDILDLEKYMEKSKESSNMQNQITSQNQDQIKEIYLSSIKSDIKQKIENKGYQVQSLDLKVENDEQYTLKELRLQVSKEAVETNSQSTNKNTNQIVENVQEVSIKIGNNTQTSNNLEANKQSKKNTISSPNRRELKDYLSSVYEISTKNIFINE
ncbi:MAG: stage III sporulation protein AF [Clostridia bacterium]|jgi:stage III sporulation protein AF|nr:stage III sporulation protein AF [Clostridia bacterium]